jgi:hypothetical protein
MEEAMPKASSLLATLDEGAESDSEMKTPQPSLMLSRPPVQIVNTLGEGATTLTPDHADLGSETLQTQQVQRSSAQSDVDATEAADESSNGTLTLPPEFGGGSSSDLSHSGRSAATTTLAGSDFPGPSTESMSFHGDAISEQLPVEGASEMSHGDERRQSAASSDYDDRNSFFDSSEEDYGEPITGSAALLTTRPDFVDMDDYESSDGHSVVEHDQLRKPIKRLPHGRDLKFVSRVDTISYDSASVSRSSLVSEEDDTPAATAAQAPDPTAGKVFAWQLAYIDSEEDEPRDAEAALRRLEGHIDRDRQRRKETKIDGWLRKVQERKARGRIYDNATDDDATDLQSSRGDPEDEARLETPPDESPIDDMQIEDAPTSLMPNEQEVESTVGNLERDTATPIPEQMDQTRVFLPSQHASMPFPVHEDAVSTGPWSDSTMTHRTHKYSLSLSHKQSAFKITEPRPILPSLPAPRESWILVHRSLKVAQHLTMIESDLWRNVPFEDLVVSSSAIDPETWPDILDWGELMKQRARIRNPNTTSLARPSNDLLIVRARFQLTVMFTGSEILLSRPNLRQMLVSKFIRIALVRSCSAVHRKNLI